MKNVLIAMDYDPTAQKVAEAGYSLAKAMGAKVMLVHIIADTIYYSSTDYSPIMGFTGFSDINPLETETVSDLKSAAQHFLDKTKMHLGDESIETYVKEGDFAESILDAAKELFADVIVMGSHSRKWLESIVMGSVTEKVLHHTSVPLYIVPTKKVK